MPSSNNTSVITPEARLAFPALFKPREDQNGKAGYSCVLLFSLGEDLQRMQAALLAAASDRFGDTQAVELLQKKKIRLPFRDQAEKADEWTGFTEGKYVSCKRREEDGPPGIVDSQGDPVMDQSLLHGGVIVRADLRAYAWDHPQNGKGVSFGLQNIMFVRDDGVKWGGRPDAAKAFAGFLDKSASAGAEGLTGPGGLFD